jgi:hypothetical protein
VDLALAENMNTDRVLFGRRSTSALFSLAAQEGLLEEGVGGPDTDGVFESYRSARVPGWLQRQISQQVILYPYVISAREDPGVFAGELLEERVLQFSSPRPTSNAEHAAVLEGNDTLAVVATEAVLGLLAAAGTDMTAAELMAAVSFAEKEDSDLAHCLKKLGIQVDSVLGNQLSVVTQLLFKEKTSETAGLLKRRAELERVAMPILAAFGELEDTILQAQAQGVDSIFLPHRSIGEPEIHAPSASLPVSLEPPEAVLLRVVTERLGRLPYRSSLRDSITLARSSAATDLRGLLHQWAAELPNGATQQLTLIEHETVKAMRALAAAKEAAFGSKLITYIGGAAVVLSAITQIPPEVGIATAIVGLGSQFIADSIQKRYNWAAFGNN